MPKIIRLIAIGLILAVLIPELAWSVEPIAKSAPPQVNTDMTGSMIKVTVGLLFVVAAIFASAWLFRRFGNFSAVPGNALRVVGGLSMGSRERIVLLQVGDEQILVGITPGSIRALHKLENPVQVEQTAPLVNENFAVKLNQAIKQWKTKSV